MKKKLYNIFKKNIEKDDYNINFENSMFHIFYLKKRILL